MVTGNENPPLIAKSIVSLWEAAIKASLEEISIKETPVEETQAIDVVDHLEEILTMAMEVGDPLEQAIPIQCLPPTISQASPSQPAPFAPSAMENLKTMVEFLKNFLSPDEK